MKSTKPSLLVYQLILTFYNFGDILFLIFDPFPGGLFQVSTNYWMSNLFFFFLCFCSYLLFIIIILFLPVLIIDFGFQLCLIYLHCEVARRLAKIASLSMKDLSRDYFETSYPKRPSILTLLGSI